MLTENEVSRIEQFRWDHRLQSQSEALRVLVAKGLEASKAETAGEPSKTSPTV